MENSKQTEQFNDEPVYYCKSCLSLRIRTVAVDSDLDYCDCCGSTDIGKSHIEEWRRLFRERNGYDYMDNNIDSNGRQKIK